MDEQVQRTILVVDEASTLSDRDLDSLMSMATTTGASLRLIGDPAQHGAIGVNHVPFALFQIHFRQMCLHLKSWLNEGAT